jgi:hypothetical protein
MMNRKFLLAYGLHGITYSHQRIEGRRLAINLSFLAAGTLRKGLYNSEFRIYNLHFSQPPAPEFLA